MRSSHEKIAFLRLAIFCCASLALAFRISIKLHSYITISFEMSSVKITEVKGMDPSRMQIVVDNSGCLGYLDAHFCQLKEFKYEN